MNDYNKVSQLNDRALSMTGGGGGGNNVLTVCMTLSAIISSIYFWQNSTTMFGGLHHYMAIPLALCIGFFFSEGAYFAWANIRKTVQGLTDVQIGASLAGLIAGILGGLLGSVSLIITSIPTLPQDFYAMKPYIAIMALLLPLMSQVIIIAVYEASGRATTQNQSMARLGALAFRSHIDIETAKAMATVQATSEFMAEQLQNGGFAERLGLGNVAQYLDDAGNSALNGQPALPSPQMTVERPLGFAPVATRPNVDDVQAQRNTPLTAADFDAFVRETGGGSGVSDLAAWLENRTAQGETAAPLAQGEL